jgi:peptidoglycan/LPS O-acetylase OafA/YrhL
VKATDIFLFDLRNHFKHRLGQVLISVVAGYFMHRCDDKDVKLEKSTIAVSWIASLTCFYVHVFHFNLKVFTEKPFMLVYYSVIKELLAIALCWLIFACQYLKSGGILRRILEHSIWQPLSKMCLSIYLVHVLYLKLISVVDEPILNPSYIWQFFIYAGDLVISVLLSGIAYLMVEAPGSQLVELIMNAAIRKPVVANKEKVPLLLS